MQCPGFIPARAGNTSQMFMFSFGPAVYPRSRGEHRVNWKSPPAPAGLSPLARGTLYRDNLRQDQSRFIPARAGNTSSPSARPLRMAVYPRSRGEHKPPFHFPPSKIGLSPLARGTRALRLASIPGRRFIPARAGNTRCPSTIHTPPSVYPRSRGEHNHEAAINGGEVGLSPLARGTRLFGSPCVG